MWNYKILELSEHECKVTIENSNGSILSFATVVNLWITSAEFCTFYNHILADVKFPAYFWEHPSLKSSSTDRPYECVITNSPSLTIVQPETKQFEAYFKTGESVVSFKNLGGDAVLVVPCPIAMLTAYTHLATFVRNAPPEQRDRFWQEVGNACHQRVNDQHFWLSTAGLGVYWLHVRLDNRPKYYRHTPYKNAVGEK